MTIPTLIIAFNRPEETRQVVQAILKQRPTRLYISIDGPRNNNVHDLRKINTIKAIIKEAKADCEILTSYNNSNLGCKLAPLKAIDWFFSLEDSGAILEDDCLPADDFLSYCKAMLQRYQSIKRVMAICGSNFQPKNHQYTADYYFSECFTSWGWATWRDRWRWCDRDYLQWGNLKNHDFLRHVSGMGMVQRTYFYRVISDSRKEDNVWDYQWMYSIWQKKGLVTVPRLNLIKNIGLGTLGTHTQHHSHLVRETGKSRVDWPNCLSPENYQVDIKADRYQLRLFGATKKRVLVIQNIKIFYIFAKNLLSNFTWGCKE